MGNLCHLFGKDYSKMSTGPESKQTINTLDSLPGDNPGAMLVITHFRIVRVFPVHYCGLKGHHNGNI